MCIYSTAPTRVVCSRPLMTHCMVTMFLFQIRAFRFNNNYLKTHEQGLECFCPSFLPPVTLSSHNMLY